MKSRVWSVQCAVRSVKCSVWGVECRVGTVVSSCGRLQRVLWMVADKRATSRDYTSTPRPTKDMAMAQNYQAPKWMVFLLNMMISVGHLVP